MPKDNDTEIAKIMVMAWKMLKKDERLIIIKTDTGIILDRVDYQGGVVESYNYCGNVNRRK